jgi:hypothetical protein
MPGDGNESVVVRGGKNRGMECQKGELRRRGRISLLKGLGPQDQEKQGEGLMVLIRRLQIFDPLRVVPPDLKIHQLLNSRGVRELPGLQHGAQILEKNQ